MPIEQNGGKGSRVLWGLNIRGSCYLSAFERNGRLDCTPAKISSNRATAFIYVALKPGCRFVSCLLISGLTPDLG